jgi:carbon starvation protein CstA
MDIVLLCSYLVVIVRVIVRVSFLTTIYQFPFERLAVFYPVVYYYVRSSINVQKYFKPSYFMRYNSEIRIAALLIIMIIINIIALQTCYSSIPRLTGYKPCRKWPYLIPGVSPIKLDI